MLPPKVMTYSANSVIAAIDARRPGLKPAKKHSLLFFAQGHHIAHFATRLFDEPITVTDRGVVVETDGRPADQPDSEGALNTIGYVVERYSALSPADLRTLIQASQPWQAAREPDAGGRIALGLLRDWFLRDDETNDPDDERPNRAERAEADRYWASHQSTLTIQAAAAERCGELQPLGLLAQDGYDPMPVFVIKSKDVLAPDTVHAYFTLCLGQGLGEQAAAVAEAEREIRAWQDRHPHLVKAPDHPHVPVTN